MGRRLNLFVLLFVLALIVVSGLVVANKPTRLGLDLKGGVELIYQGTPTGQVTEVKRRRHRTLDRDHPRADRPARRRRAGGLAARHHRDLGQPARRDQRPAGDRPGGHDRAALLLRLGTEPDRPRAGHRRQPRCRTAPRSGRRSQQRMASGRAQHQQTGKPAADLLRRLPDRLRRGPAGRRTEPRTRLHRMLDHAAALLPVLEKPHAQADRRPRVRRKRPLHQRDRRKA